MSRSWIQTAAITMLSALGTAGAVHAQSELGPELPSPSASPVLAPNLEVPSESPVFLPPGYDPAGAGQTQTPAQFVGQPTYTPPGPVVGGVPGYGTGAQQSGYVRLNAPMYPCPRPNIPAWTGSTMITNQALAPHEMLYPHKYRAMYPPFYHRVHGFYFWTPFGMRSHESWKLQGTMVKVNYRSHWPHLMGPHKPWVSTNGGPWK